MAAASQPTEARPTPATARRLESLEASTNLILHNLEELTSSVRSLREKDGDMEASLSRVASEQRKQTESLAEMMRSQQASFNAALEAEAGARKSQADEFKKALEEQSKAALEALKALVFKTAFVEVGKWLLTTIIGAAMASAAYFITAVKR